MVLDFLYGESKIFNRGGFFIDRGFFSTTEKTRFLVALSIGFISVFLNISVADCSERGGLETVSVVKDELAVEERRIRLPRIVEGRAGRQIVLFSDIRWEVRRGFPDGYLDVFAQNDSGTEMERINLPLHFRKNSYPLLALSSKDDLYFVIYDVVSNIPSGRSSTVVKSGFDVYRLNRREKKLSVLAEGLPLGGLDSPIYGEIDSGVVNLCGSGRCFSVSHQGASEWNVAFLNGYEFVELDFRKGRAAAIVRRVHDDRSSGALDASFAEYSLVVFDASGGHLRALPKNEIPWRLRWSGKNLIYSVAESSSQLLDVFYYEFNRMPFRGTIDFGGNNLEGRVAWSQVYYLSGLLALLEGKLKKFPAHQASARERVCKEALLIGELSRSDYPGLSSKRYSIDREPLLSALHLGRVGDVLVRANGVGCHIPPEDISFFRVGLASLDKTLEEPISLTHDGKTWRYLGIKKRSPFWSDGANVPYNYISAYVQGYLALNPTPLALVRVGELLSPLLELEFKTPYPSLWRYWWGPADDGWRESDSVSLNTPAYGGNRKGLAHISYRTMDASAILMFARHGGSLQDSALPQHFRSLVASGSLLPSLNEAFAQTGDPVPLQNHVARRYARAASWAEIQSQVWALAQLAQLAKY